MTNVTKYEDINTEEFNYNKPEKYNNSYFGSMSYGETNVPIYIQTPKIKFTGNIKDILEQTNPVFDVSIPKNRLDFYDLFLNIDNQNIKNTFNNSKEWFSKELPMEAIDDMYKPITKGFKKDTEPTLKFKLPLTKGKPQCIIYNQQRTFIDINDINHGDEVILILHLKGLKVLKQYYYCDCYISQIKVFKLKDLKYNILKDYSILDESNDEQEDLDIFDEEIIEKIVKEKKEKEEKSKEITRLRKEIQNYENNILEKKVELEDLVK